MYKYLMDKLLLIRKSQSTDQYQNHTVDALNPAPPGMFKENLQIMG